MDTSFYRATDTPIMDLWWVSKPGWAALFVLGGGKRDVLSLILCKNFLLTSVSPMLQIFPFFQWGEGGGVLEQ